MLFIDFQVVIWELAELGFGKRGAGDGEGDLCIGDGDVGVALDPFARHDGRGIEIDIIGERAIGRKVKDELLEKEFRKVREEVTLKRWGSSEDMCEVGAELLHRVHEAIQLPSKAKRSQLAF